MTGGHRWRGLRSTRMSRSALRIGTNAPHEEHFSEIIGPWLKKTRTGRAAVGSARNVPAVRRSSESADRLTPAQPAMNKRAARRSKFAEATPGSADTAKPLRPTRAKCASLNPHHRHTRMKGRPT